jgi:hypothetical protein
MDLLSFRLCSTFGADVTLAKLIKLGPKWTTIRMRAPIIATTTHLRFVNASSSALNAKIVLGKVRVSQNATPIPASVVRVENLNLSKILTFADNAAAVTGGLLPGDLYKTSANDLKIVV